MNQNAPESLRSAYISELVNATFEIVSYNYFFHVSELKRSYNIIYNFICLRVYPRTLCLNGPLCKYTRTVSSE
jgi:hypothetical protein